LIDEHNTILRRIKKPGLKNGAFNLEGKKVEFSNFMGQLLSWTLPSYMNQNIGKKRIEAKAERR
jgi:hypothetical protein